MASALAMKESVFCSNSMKDLGSRSSPSRLLFTAKSPPLFVLRVVGNQACNSRTKHIALRFFYIRELVKVGAISLNHISMELQLADIGITFVSKHRIRLLIDRINNFGDSSEVALPSSCLLLSLFIC